MIFKNIYMKTESITKTEYLEDRKEAAFYRAHYSLPCDPIYIKCTRYEYEYAIMLIEREMQKERTK